MPEESNDKNAMNTVFLMVIVAALVGIFALLINIRDLLEKMAH